MKQDIKIQETTCEKEIDYPAEITFKSIFRSSPDTLNNINSVLSEQGIEAKISQNQSGKGKFISYTITAVFPGREELDNVCSNIKSIDNFMTMF